MAKKAKRSKKHGNSDPSWRSENESDGEIEPKSDRQKAAIDDGLDSTLRARRQVKLDKDREQKLREEARLRM